MKFPSRPHIQVIEPAGDASVRLLNKPNDHYAIRQTYHQVQQALADAQSLAARNDHPYIEPIHVLSALLSDPDSGAGSLLARAGVAVNRLQPAIEQALKSLPQVQGDDNVQVGRELQGVLTRTDKEAARRGDTYIASELFLLALADDKGPAGRILQEAGLQKKALEAAIDAVRGGESVSAAEGESTARPCPSTRWT